MKRVISSINYINICPTTFIKSSRTKQYRIPTYHSYCNGKKGHLCILLNQILAKIYPKDFNLCSIDFLKQCILNRFLIT